MLKLYSGPLSLFTAKVRIALAEKALDYQRVEVGWTRAKAYEPHHPDVVALNPKRQVPVLVDGDTVVYDSTLILEYLEERSPTPPLYPPAGDLAGRARCRQLEAAADEIVFPQVWKLIEQNVYGGGDPAAVEAARAELEALEEPLDKALADREYLCGAFTVADIATFVMLSAAATLGAPPPERFEHLQAWLGRVGGRPSARRDSQEMVAFFLAH